MLSNTQATGKIVSLKDRHLAHPIVTSIFAQAFLHTERLFEYL